MDIEYLREFVVLSRTLNFSASARELHVAQSTLSRHVAAVESEIRTPLLTRSANSIALTPQGRLFLEQAIDIVERYDQAVDAVRAFQSVPAWTVRLGGYFQDASIFSFLSTAISCIGREQIAVEVELLPQHSTDSFVELSVWDAYEAAKRGLADVTLLYLSRRIDTAMFAHTSLYREPFAIFVPQSHPLAKRKKVSLFDLRDDFFVIVPVWQTYADRIIEACEASGFKPKTRIRVFESFGDAMVARHSDEVICIAGSNSVNVAPPSLSGLVRLDLEDQNAYFEVVAMYRDDSANPGIPLLIEVFQRVAALGGEGGDWTLSHGLKNPGLD